MENEIKETKNVILEMKRIGDTTRRDRLESLLIEM
jgi:hypothetical protein